MNPKAKKRKVPRKGSLRTAPAMLNQKGGAHRDKRERARKRLARQEQQFWVVTCGVWERVR